MKHLCNGVMQGHSWDRAHVFSASCGSDLSTEKYIYFHSLTLGILCNGKRNTSLVVINFIASRTIFAFLLLQ